MSRKRNLTSLKSLLKTTWLSPLSKYVLQAYRGLAWTCGKSLYILQVGPTKAIFKMSSYLFKSVLQQTYLTKIYPWLKNFWSENSTTKCYSSQEARSWKPSKLWNTSKLLLSLKVFQKLYDIIWMKIKYKLKQLLFFIHFFWPSNQLYSWKCKAFRSDSESAKWLEPRIFDFTHKPKMQFDLDLLGMKIA